LSVFLVLQAHFLGLKAYSGIQNPSYALGIFLFIFAMIIHDIISFSATTRGEVSATRI